MSATFFSPQLYIPGGIKDVSFYEKAFSAIELRKFLNEDDSVHVAEFSIEGNVFQLHEDKPGAGRLHPGTIKGTTVLIGLFVEDVDAAMDKALAAGAILVSPAQSYDYGYRQGEVKDPFGHVWMIEKNIGG